MIVSNLQNSWRVESLHPLFKPLFDYVKSHDLLHAELGRVVIDGDNLYVNNVEAEGVDAACQLLEVHRKYIDVHILLEGKERIGWKALEDAGNEAKAYDASADCAFYAEEAEQYVDLKPGQFMVAYPEDMHAPLIGQGRIRKLIAKVKL